MTSEPTRAVAPGVDVVGHGVLIIDGDGCGFRGIIHAEGKLAGMAAAWEVHYRSGPLWKVGWLSVTGDAPRARSTAPAAPVSLVFDAGEGDGPIAVRLARIMPLETVMGAAR